MHIFRGFSIAQIPANRVIDKKAEPPERDLHDVTHGPGRISRRELFNGACSPAIFVSLKWKIS